MLGGDLLKRLGESGVLIQSGSAEADKRHKEVAPLKEYCKRSFFETIPKEVFKLPEKVVKLPQSHFFFAAEVRRHVKFLQIQILEPCSDIVC